MTKLDEILKCHCSECFNESNDFVCDNCAEAKAAILDLLPKKRKIPENLMTLYKHETDIAYNLAIEETHKAFNAEALEKEG